MRSEIKACVGSALLGKEELEPLLNKLSEKAKETNKIALPGTIRADQDCDVVEGEVIQISDGLEASN